MPKLRRVLSIDGGGIRGIIPAFILKEIEARAEAPACQLFDLIAGTSTGGILALALVCQDENGHPRFTAAELVNLYEREGHLIFPRDSWYRMRAVGNLLEERFATAGLDGILERYFGSARLKDALTDVLIPSYEIERRVPWFFRNARASTDPEYDFLMKDVARAASAAPTYFEPMQIGIEERNDYWALVDGGVFANNPAMCAYVEARTRWPKDEIVLVSLGTGVLTRRFPYQDVKGWGLLSWARPLLNVVFDGVSDTVDYQLGQLLPLNNHKYHRFQVRLDIGNDDMDDASRTNLRALRLLAEERINEDKSRIESLCDRLKP